MQLQILKSKIHNAFVTEANIDYIGSITIDENFYELVSKIGTKMNLQQNNYSFLKELIRDQDSI